MGGDGGEEEDAAAGVLGDHLSVSERCELEGAIIRE